MSIPLEIRFWTKVNKGKPEECWEWKGAKRKEGPPQYGIGFMWAGANRKERWLFAPRVAWEVTHGPIPEGVCVLHACDNPHCCNPNHLWLGTRIDNNRDRDKKGRGKLLKGKARKDAKLSPEQVREIREEYQSKKCSQTSLARKYKVSQATISRVLLHAGWWREIE